MFSKQMELFEINNTQRRINKLKTLTIDLLICGTLYLLFANFTKTTSDNILFSFVPYFLLRLGNHLTQQHICKILIDEANDVLTISLTSIMSGDDEKSYPLSALSSSINTNSRWATWLNGPLTLKIFIPNKKMFRINGCYGFSPVTLMGVDAHLK